MNAQQAVVAALRHKTIIPAFNIPYLPMVEPVVQAIIDENSVAMVQVARLEWEKFESQSPEAVAKEYFKFCKEGYTLLHLDHIPAIDEDQKNVDFLPLLKRALDAGYRVPESPHSRVCRRSRGALYFGRYCQKITITFENLQRRQQWLTPTLHTPEGWEVQPGKTLAVNLEQGHCNVPLARVTLEVTPHALSRARNDLIIQVVSEGRPTQLFIPIVLLASGDYQIFSE